MPVPTLIIGLGTTGHEIAGKVKTNLAKRIDKNTENYISYAVFDTAIDPPEFYGIEGAEYKAIGDFDVKRAIKEWKETDYSTVWPDQKYTPKKASFVDGAGMIRPNGKLAFWYQMRDIRSHLDPVLRNLATKNNDVLDHADDINVWITGTLSNATCGGGFLDLAYLLIDMINDRQKRPNINFCFLCGSVVWEFNQDPEKSANAAKNGLAAINEFHRWMYINPLKNEPEPYSYTYRHGEKINIENDTPGNIMFLVQSQDKNGSTLSHYDHYKDILSNGLSVFVTHSLMGNEYADLVADANGMDNYGSLNYLKIELPINDIKKYCINKYALNILTTQLLNNNISELGMGEIRNQIDFINSVDFFIRNELKILEKGANQLFNYFDDLGSFNSLSSEITNIIDTLMTEENAKTTINSINSRISNALKAYDESLNLETQQMLRYHTDYFSVINEFEKLAKDQKEIYNKSLIFRIDYQLVTGFLGKGYWQIAKDWLNIIKESVEINSYDVLKNEYAEVDSDTNWENTIGARITQLMTAYDKWFNKNHVIRAKQGLKQGMLGQLSYETKRIQCKHIFKIYEELTIALEKRISALSSYLERMYSVKSEMERENRDIVREELGYFGNSSGVTNPFIVNIGLYKDVLENNIYKKVLSLTKMEQKKDGNITYISNNLLKEYQVIHKILQGPRFDAVKVHDPKFMLSMENSIYKSFYSEKRISGEMEEVLNKDFKIEDILTAEIDSLLTDYWIADKSKDFEKIAKQTKRMKKFFTDMNINVLKNMGYDKKQSKTLVVATKMYIDGLAKKVTPFWKHNEGDAKMNTLIMYNPQNELLHKELNLEGTKVDMPAMSSNQIEIVVSEFKIPVNKLTLFESMYEEYKSLREKTTSPAHIDRRYLSRWHSDIFDLDVSTDFDSQLVFALAEGLGLITCSGRQRRNYKLGIGFGNFARGKTLAAGREESIRILKDNNILLSDLKYEIEEAFKSLKYKQDSEGSVMGNRAIFEFLFNVKIRLLNDSLVVEKAGDTSLIKLYKQQIKQLDKFIEDRGREFELTGSLDSIERDVRKSLENSDEPGTM